MSSSSTMQLSTYVLKTKVFKRTWGVILIARLPKSHVGRRGDHAGATFHCGHWCIDTFASFLSRSFLSLLLIHRNKMNKRLLLKNAAKHPVSPSANSGIYLTENKVFCRWQPQVERRRSGKWGNVDGKWWNRGSKWEDYERGQVPEDRQILSAMRCAGDFGDSGGQLRLRRNPWNRCACGRTLPFFSSAWRIGDQSDLDDTGVVTGDTLSL